MRHPLHRHGAIRAAFDDESPDPYVQLGRAATALQLEPDSVWLAQELAQAGGSDDLDERERLASVLAVLLNMVALNRGSTRFPLRPVGGGAADYVERTIASMLEHLARSPEDGDSPDDVEPPAKSLRDAEALAGEVRRFFEEPLLPALVGRAGQVDGSVAHDYKSFLVDDGWVYTEKTWSHELSIARKLADVCRKPARVDIEAGLDAMLDDFPFDLSETRRATKTRQFRQVLRYRLGILTGGPGTGKTTMVLAALRTLLRSGYEPDDIALAAPTGKAAKRMRESIEEQLWDHLAPLEGIDARLRANLPESKTLHRLLRYSPRRGTFRRGPDDPIPAKIVVVDEASMLDLSLMDALLGALADDARLLLVGDADQLPAVGAGAAFRDLSQDAPDTEDAAPGDDALVPGSARLVQNFRSNEHIQYVAGRFNRGKIDISAELESGEHIRALEGDEFARVADQLVGLVEPREDEFGTAEFLEAWWRAFANIGNYLPREQDSKTATHRRRDLLTHDEQGRGFDESSTRLLDSIFDQYESARLLAVTRSTVAMANRSMHRNFRATYASASTHTYLAGEPVMVTRNDYAHHLFNGDQGVVLYTMTADEASRTRSSDGNFAKKRVVFRTSTGYRAVRIGQIWSRLEHAYALTVHKSQGSEFGTVGLVLANDPKSPLNTRELVYTGLTRAKHRAIVFGDQNTLQAAAGRQLRRYSGIRDKLAGLVDL